MIEIRDPRLVAWLLSHPQPGTGFLRIRSFTGGFLRWPIIDGAHDRGDDKPIKRKPREAA